MVISLNAASGWIMLPSSLKRDSGAPRFQIAFPHEFSSDAGARHLVASELGHGYEQPTRDLLEQMLRPGDVFVDVGAHWGFFSFQAATHAAGVSVIAFEPDPTNASILFRNVADNGLIHKIHVVSAACGDKTDIAPLVANSTMMHSIRGIGLKPPFAKGPAKWVPVVTLDEALSRFPQAANARILLKIDAEGFEPQVVAGAAATLRSGRVATIVWECGHAFVDGPEREAMLHMVETLSALGFRHLLPNRQHDAREFRPFDADTGYTGNVISAGARMDEF
ncbi:MAG TPA: FkbM family methyltransferase [Bradyrhizobium sp.]|nr:FkbM family methyltransferase [Bradyrhizobium sp.]